MIFSQMDLPLFPVCHLHVLTWTRVILLRACDGGMQRQLCIVSENEWMHREGRVVESGHVIGASATAELVS